MTNDHDQDDRTAAESYAAARPAPTIPGHWLFGHARALREHLPEFFADAALAGGGLARGRIGWRRFVTIADPEAIREILVSKSRFFRRSWEHRDLAAVFGKGLVSIEGEEWRAQRQLLQPAFTASRIRRIGPASERTAVALCTRWDAFARDGRPIPVVEEVQTATLATICDALLSVDLRAAEAGSLAHDFAAAVRGALAILGGRHGSACPMPHFIPTPTNRSLRRTSDTLDRFLESHLRPRFEHTAPPRDDIVQSMIDAMDAAHAKSADAPDAQRPHAHAHARAQASTFGWPEALAETKTLFLAGFETTATLLVWALHHLSHHPDAARRWHEECDAVAAGRGDAPTFGYDDLERLPFLHAVLQESLRLSPPIFVIPRLATCDIGIRGVRIRRGDEIFVSVLGAHRNPAVWTDPTRFDPDRFAPGATYDKHAFLPFGLGGHFCIGAAVAMAEATLLLATIGARYRLVPTVPHAIATSGRVTFVPKDEIALRLERR